MSSIADAIFSKLLARNPFEGFDAAAYPQDLTGSGGNDVLRQVFAALRPNLLIEVGSWKGVSACFWAGLLKQSGIDGAVICVDTWLGGLDHMEPNVLPQWDLKPFLKHGYPALYYQFLANVVQQGVAEYVVPIANTSTIAARWLRKQGIQAPLIYIDASHDEIDVYDDLVNYWKLLSIGGIMCGDDYALPWNGVIAAVTRFARERELHIQFAQNIWILQKSQP